MYIFFHFRQRIEQTNTQDHLAAGRYQCLRKNTNAKSHLMRKICFAIQLRLKHKTRNHHKEERNEYEKNYQEIVIIQTMARICLYLSQLPSFYAQIFEISVSKFTFYTLKH